MEYKDYDELDVMDKFREQMIDMVFSCKNSDENRSIITHWAMLTIGFEQTQFKKLHPHLTDEQVKASIVNDMKHDLDVLKSIIDEISNCVVCVSCESEEELQNTVADIKQKNKMRLN